MSGAPQVNGVLQNGQFVGNSPFSDEMIKG